MEPFLQIEGETKGVEELTCFVDGHAVRQRILTNKEKVSFEHFNLISLFYNFFLLCQILFVLFVI